MTYIECLLRVLKYIGYFIWFTGSAALLSVGFSYFGEDDSTWSTRLCFFGGLISLICCIAFIVYKLQ